MKLNRELQLRLPDEIRSHLTRRAVWYINQTLTLATVKGSSADKLLVDEKVLRNWIVALMVWGHSPDTIASWFATFGIDGSTVRKCVLTHIRLILESQHA